MITTTIKQNVKLASTASQKLIETPVKIAQSHDHLANSRRFQDNGKGIGNKV